jgi:hypothetical protein
MRRALRRAGWALAAAGGIGIAAPAGAQTQAIQIIGPAGHVDQPGEVIMMTDGQAGLEEGQVELGLLADPMLFSYGLGAHVQGATLELRGFVPTEEVRQQALKVAREQTGLHVIDKLKLAPNLATRCSIDKPENIQRAAKELLEEAVPSHGRTMDVKCDARGRVTVSGTVASYEDRVLVSRKLRQVSGCSCVVNQLEVAGAEKRPTVPTGTAVILQAPAMPAQPAVRHSEPPAPAVPTHTVTTTPWVASDPPSPATPRPHTETVVLPPAPPLPVHPAEVALPPAPPVSVRPAEVALPPVHPVPTHPVAPVAPKENDPPKLPMPRVYQEPVSLPPAPAPAVKPPPVAPAVKPLPDLPSIPKPVVSPVIDITPSQAKPDSLPKLPTPAIDRDRPLGGGTTGSTTLNLSPVDHPKPKPVVKIPEIVNQPSAAAPKTLPLPPVVPLSPAPPLPKLPVIEKQGKGGSEESYVSEGTITLDDDPPPAKPAGGMKVTTPPAAPKVALPPVPPAKPASDPVKLPAPAAKVPPTSMKADEGTLTLTPPPMPPSQPASDPMKLSVPPAKPPAPVAPPRTNVPAAVRLKERVQGVCGPAYEVKVMTRGKNYMQLDVTGGSGGDGQNLMERITPVLKSAEFSPYEINVDVVISGK